MNFVNFLAGDVSCGNGIVIPEAIVGLIRAGVFVIQVIVPLLLIIWGMLDFAKGIIGSDEDKIKAGQKKFIQRLIAAIIVFLIISLVGFIIQLVRGLGGDGNNAGSAWKCAADIIKG